MAARSRLFVLRLTATAVVSFFFLFCVRDSLLADYRETSWQSLAVRVFLILGAAVLIAMRLEFQADKSIVNHKSAALIIVFGAVLFSPLIFQLSFLPKSYEKVSERIARYQKNGESTVSLVRRIPVEYKKYFDKRFNLPKSYVHLEALVKIYIFGVSPNSRVALGLDGFFFEGYGARKVEKGIVEKFDNIADYMGQIPFSDQELKMWKRTLEERRDWLKEQGSEYVFVLAPTKAFIYPEFLPKRLQRKKQGQTRYVQLAQYVRKSSDIYFIDLLPALLEEKRNREYPLLYYKTDFHWNFYGSFIAYREIVTKLALFFPQYNFVPLALDDFELNINRHWAHHRFMDLVGLPEKLHKNGHYITMIPREGTALASVGDVPSEGIHDVYPKKHVIKNDKGESMRIRLLRNPEATSVPSMLLLGDSFFEKCIYYFTAHARRILNYRTIVNFPAKIFKYEKPTIVIQEILNMFLLRPPPQNPPLIRQSYLKGKFSNPLAEVVAGNNKNTVGLTSSDGMLVIPLPPRLQQDGKTIIAKVELRGKREGSIIAGCRDGQEGTGEIFPRQVSVPGSSVVFAELPKSGCAALVLNTTENTDLNLSVTGLDFHAVNMF